MDFYVDRACPGGVGVHWEAKTRGNKDIGPPLKEAIQAILEAFFSGCFHKKSLFNTFYACFSNFSMLQPASSESMTAVRRSLSALCNFD